VDSAVADIQGLNWNGLIDRSWCVRYAKNNIKGTGSTKTRICNMLHIITVMLSKVYRKIPKSHSKGGTVPLEDKYEKDFRFQG